MIFRQVICCLFLSTVLSAGEKPNILLILADDLGWSDLGCYGSDWLETPNLDQLAGDGVRFTNAYAAAPICSASRASILTGRTTARNHFEFVTKNAPGRQDFGATLETPPLTLNLDHELITIPEMLKPQGYRSAFFGKWHLNQHHQRYLGWSPTHGPRKHGFDVAIEDFGSHPYSYWKKKDQRTFLEVDPGEFGDDAVTQHAIDFLEEDHRDPFFLMISHYYVHDPNHTRLRWLFDRYFEKLPQDSPHREAMAHYGAMVTTLDHHVGEVLLALEEQGLAESTLVLFTSDNGGHPSYAGNAPLRGSKWNLYEGGLRVPLIARHRGKIPPQVALDLPVVGYDILPTLAELAGLTPPQEIDGQSFFDYLSKGASAPQRPLYWHFPYYHPEGEKFHEAPLPIGVDDRFVSRTQPQSAIREGQWKLITFAESDHIELYDLSEDQAEQSNLATEAPEVATRLHKKLIDYLESVDARFATP